MKSLCRPLFAIAILAAAACAAPAHAQLGSSAINTGLTSSQDNANITTHIIQLKAQLEAIEKETLRRLACQSNPDPYGQAMVSNATGCIEIPGLRAYVASQITSATTNTTCSLPWGGSVFSGQTVTAYAASSVASGQSCASQIRTCTDGVLSGTYSYNSCSVQADPCASIYAAGGGPGAGLCATYCATYGYEWVVANTGGLCVH